MKSAKGTGRTLGVLLLLQFAAAIMVPFILLRPLTVGSPGFLTTAAENSVQIRSAVLLFFVGGALTVSLGVTALPVLRRHGSGWAYWFLVICAASFTLDAVHNAAVMTMLSLSEQYVGEGAVAPAAYMAVGAAVASARRWAHYSQLVAIGGWIFVFYASLFRFALIPRALAAAGLVGIVLQFVGVTLLMYLGYSAVGWMAMPLFPIQVTTAVWLMVKGLREPTPASAA